MQPIHLPEHKEIIVVDDCSTDARETFSNRLLASLMPVTSGRRTLPFAEVSTHPRRRQRRTCLNLHIVFKML
jgi:glycosyltransferase involved in cell wall biosynthesis